MQALETRWRWPSLRARPAAQLFLLFAGVGFIQASAVRLAFDAEGNVLPLYAPYVWHITGAIGAWIAFPIVQTAVVNAPSPRSGWTRLLLVHAAGYVVFTIVHIIAMFSLREITSRVFDATAVLREPTLSRLSWEIQNDLVVYPAVAGIWSLLRAWDERRAASLQAAQLEAQLATARLDALSAQLDPHFLFNALNTVSAVMYEDLPRTEKLLADLGQMLRTTLEPGSATWSLAEEREHAGRYIGLARARFGDRLHVEWHLEIEDQNVSVPRFSIQTLVENAIKHNQHRVEPLSISIRARTYDEIVHIEVEDDGVGLETDAVLDPAHGLGRLQETLRLLHGDAARLDRRRGIRSGAKIELYFPEVVP